MIIRIVKHIKKWKSTPLILGSLLGLFLLMGCDDNEDPVPVITDISYVSIYHGSPDADGLDILTGGTGQINALPFEYEDYSSYLNFYAGNRELIFLDADNEVATVIDTTLNFEEDEIYSLFIADSLQSIEIIQVKDSFPSVADGQTMIRLAHLSPDAPSVDIYVENTPILSDVSFKDVSDFISVDSGRETIEVRSSETGDVLLTIPNLELFDEEYYNVIINGFVNPPAGNMNELGSDVIRL